MEIELLVDVAGVWLPEQVRVAVWAVAENARRCDGVLSGRADVAVVDLPLVLVRPEGLVLAKSTSTPPTVADAD